MRLAGNLCNLHVSPWVLLAETITSSTPLPLRELVQPNLCQLPLGQPLLFATAAPFLVSRDLAPQCNSFKLSRSAGPPFRLLE